MSNNTENLNQPSLLMIFLYYLKLIILIVYAINFYSGIESIFYFTLLSK